jgi:hypothetical protein
LHCDLKYDGALELQAAFNDSNEYFLSGDTDGWIIDQDRFDSSRFYLSTLDEAADSQLGRPVVLPLLQSPIVILASLRDMFEEEQSLRLSDSERETLIRDNTRKLYMATTRAGQRLVITYIGDMPRALKKKVTNLAI